MSHPMSNLALAVHEVPIKIFVKETPPVEESQPCKKFNLQFEGIEAKLAYEEIVLQDSQKTQLPEESTSKIEKHNQESKAPEKCLNSNKYKIHTLFKAVELGDKKFISENFNAENVNIIDQFGWTPLMSACFSGHKEIVELLLKLGAKTRLKDKSGFQALDLAIKKNHLDIARMLKENPYKKQRKLTKDVEESEKSTSDQQSEELDKFYCDLCKMTFTETTRKKHETSTLHIFNSEPKLKNAYYGIPKQNKGYQMLLNRGWDEEGGLGPDGQGHKYPVKTLLKRDREGLGHLKKSVPRVTHFDAGDIEAVKYVNRHKSKTLKKRDRLKQLSRDAAKTRAYRQALS